MVLEAIYIVRHGFRTSYTVDSQTGVYTSNIRTPTGIPTDAPLTSYGVAQSHELASRLTTVHPPIERVYSSPFFRCVQTIAPTVEKLRAAGKLAKDSSGCIRGENGIGEWYGTAPFEHPSPASPEVISSLITPSNTSTTSSAPIYSLSYTPVLTPPNTGESIPSLHTRVATVLNRIIAAVDAEENGPKAILICTHAATMIASGRVLTGKKPGKWEEEDFGAWTCGVSTFLRRSKNSSPGVGLEARDEEFWESTGIAGGWDCVSNGDCSFLSGGAERGW
ncbi:MAG: 40S ribosomal protein S22 [Chaenotheca gracillima]|nr:MAG: 40S ribosomal protein S22 [Chaenotheca gracillima]